jgi:hypothetical protein
MFRNFAVAAALLVCLVCASTSQAALLQRVSYSFANQGLGTVYMPLTAYQWTLAINEPGGGAGWVQTGIRPNETGYVSPDVGATFSAPAATRDSIANLLTQDPDPLHYELVIQNVGSQPVLNQFFDSGVQRFVPSFGPNFAGYNITDIQNHITTFQAGPQGASGALLSISTSGYYDIIGDLVPEPTSAVLVAIAGCVFGFVRRR